MSHIELSVKPILEKMGLFNGKEISVKEVFEEYLKICPKGIGPLGAFKSIVAHKLNLDLKEIRNGNKMDLLFIYNKPYDEYYNLLNYDPRTEQL
jgi:hypothetical protein